MTDDMSLTPNEPAKHSKWRSPKRIVAVGRDRPGGGRRVGLRRDLLLCQRLQRLARRTRSERPRGGVRRRPPSPTGALRHGGPTRHTADPAATTVAPADPAATTVAPADPAADPAAGYDGDWVATEESQFGYRVDEVLAGVNTTAVGRSNQLTGTMTVEGTTVPAVDVEVQVATITSDESQRDNNFRSSVMDTERVPHRDVPPHPADRTRRDPGRGRTDHGERHR